MLVAVILCVLAGTVAGFIVYKLQDLSSSRKSSMKAGQAAQAKPEQRAPENAHDANKTRSEIRPQPPGAASVVVHDSGAMLSVSVKEVSVYNGARQGGQKGTPGNMEPSRCVQCGAVVGENISYCLECRSKATDSQGAERSKDEVPGTTVSRAESQFVAPQAPPSAAWALMKKRDQARARLQGTVKGFLLGGCLVIIMRWIKLPFVLMGLIFLLIAGLSFFLGWAAYRNDDDPLGRASRLAFHFMLSPCALLYAIVAFGLSSAR